MSYDSKDIEINVLKRKIKQLSSLTCELCERLGENVCKDGEECDWKDEEDA